MIKSYHNDLGSSKKSFSSNPIQDASFTPKQRRRGKEWQILAIVIALVGGGWGIAYAKDAYDLYIERETIIEEMGQLVGQNKVLLKKIEFGERTIRDLEAEIAKLDIENRKDARTRDENRVKHAQLRAELEGKQ